MQFSFSPFLAIIVLVLWTDTKSIFKTCREYCNEVGLVTKFLLAVGENMKREVPHMLSEVCNSYR